jgi:hypothetical protein
MGEKLGAAAVLGDVGAWRLIGVVGAVACSMVGTGSSGPGGEEERSDRGDDSVLGEAICSDIVVWWEKGLVGYLGLMERT